MRRPSQYSSAFLVGCSTSRLVSLVTVRGPLVAFCQACCHGRLAAALTRRLTAAARMIRRSSVPTGPLRSALLATPFTCSLPGIPSCLCKAYPHPMQWPGWKKCRHTALSLRIGSWGKEGLGPASGRLLEDSRDQEKEHTPLKVVSNHQSHYNGLRQLNLAKYHHNRWPRKVALLECRTSCTKTWPTL